MRLTKILIYLIVLLVLIVPDARNWATTQVQSVVVRSGIVNASTPSEKKEQFNFDFNVKDISGNKVDFKTFRGKVIFLNLWATWCGPCRSEMPGIQELFNSIKTDQVMFVMLSLDEERRTDKVKNYINEQAFTFPVFMPFGSLTSQLYVDTIPTTLVIDKDGYIVMKEVGMRNYNTTKFKKYLEDLVTK